MGREPEKNLAVQQVSSPTNDALNLRLRTVLAGAATRDDPERLELAYLAYQQGRQAGAARLFAEALVHDPKLAADRRTQHAYNAACAAALAGSRQCKDEPMPDEVVSTELRRQALGWLRAELAEWVRILDAGPSEAKGMVPATMIHWKGDADLAGVRDPAELARLPEAERANFARLWADVDALLARAQATAAARP